MGPNQSALVAERKPGCCVACDVLLAQYTCGASECRSVWNNARITDARRASSPEAKRTRYKADYQRRLRRNCK